MQANVFIVEDHPLMREMLTELIDESEGMRVCGSAPSGEDALALIASSDPNLILIDVSLPKMSGLAFVEAARKQLPATRCIVLSGHGERIFADRALSAGANGFVVKGNPEEIVDAIRRVFDGETYLSASLRASD